MRRYSTKKLIDGVEVARLFYSIEEKPAKEDTAAVRQDNTVTPREKRKKLDALTAERNALLKATVKAYEETRK